MLCCGRIRYDKIRYDMIRLGLKRSFKRRFKRRLKQKIRRKENFANATKDNLIFSTAVFVSILHVNFLCFFRVFV